VYWQEAIYEAMATYDIGRYSAWVDHIKPAMTAAARANGEHKPSAYAMMDDDCTDFLRSHFGDYSIDGEYVRGSGNKCRVD
jgi:hypothetical protein